MLGCEGGGIKGVVLWILIGRETGKEGFDVYIYSDQTTRPCIGGERNSVGGV